MWRISVGASIGVRYGIHATHRWNSSATRLILCDNESAIFLWIEQFSEIGSAKDLRHICFFFISPSKGVLNSRRSLDKMHLLSNRISFAAFSFLSFRSTVDAVYAMANAIHETMKRHCNDDFRHCNAFHTGLVGADLLASIRELSFVSLQGARVRTSTANKSELGFYHFSSSSPPDSIQSERRRARLLQHLSVSEERQRIQLRSDWIMARNVIVFFICRYSMSHELELSSRFSLDLKNETVRWENHDEAPKSFCSEPCPAGHVHNHQDQCCWSCVKCREEFEYVENDTCISCRPGWAPNEKKTGCDKLKAETIDWLTPWAYVSNNAWIIICICRLLQHFEKFVCRRAPPESAVTRNEE